MDAEKALRSSELELAFEQYTGHLRAFRHCAENTLRAYRSDGRRFVDWCHAEGICDPSGLDQGALLRYLSDQPPVSPNTTRRRIHALSGWFRFMVQQGILARSPAEGLPLPRRKRALPRYPDAAQALALIEAARTHLERAVICLLLGTGVRRAELIGVDIGDFSPELDDLRVTGKGDKQRNIAVPEAVRTVLRDYLDVRGTDAGPLLLNRAGNRLGVTSLRRLFARLLRRSGLEGAGLSLHSTRHYYGTMLARAGVDLGTIRDLMGHSDVSVTSVYLHSDLRSKRAAVELLPIALPGGGVNG